MDAGSIFTFEDDPQRVSSPWLGDDHRRKKSTPSLQTSTHGHSVEPELLSDYKVTKLEAEPQEGPHEYKLHLLLRARRKFHSMSTMPGGPKLKVKAEPRSISASNQSRQTRLQQLTTQLLWRLQQSCPLHSLKPKDLVIPQLPDDAVDLSEAITPRQPLMGLEESRGALYEIGVSDDGTLVGLTKDEMDESVTTLRVMAATLGCKVEVLRYVIVGECEWYEAAELVDNGFSRPAQTLRHARLWVAEAFVAPDFSSDKAESHEMTATKGRHGGNGTTHETPSKTKSTTEQLRVTLTGPTTSGKSTFLGTLSTGTLDNGRGQSRLSLFKHRHEVISGMTSSVAQELIGYQDDHIVNYAQPHIASWLDIHYESESGRLVFVSDSAGHPRFRRTILRGLFGWAPHWTVLCLAADDPEAHSAKDGLSSSAQDVLGSAGANVDLTKAHIELCLKLRTPLVVVITKMDLASKASISRSAGKALTLIKEAQRTPKMLQSTQKGAQDPRQVPAADRQAVKSVVSEMKDSGDLLKVVPIVFTSAVNGNGVGLMHALLESLPLPPPPTARDFVGNALNPEQPSCVFHIDDTFSRPADFTSLTDNPDQIDMGIVVSGYLRFGQLSVGDDIVVGPFASGGDDFKGMTPEERPSPAAGGYGLSISHPSSAELAKIAIRNAVAASTIKGEWHKAKIVSIRNLRLSVRTLEAGQVGTVGILLDVPPSAAGPTASEEGEEEGASAAPPVREIPRIRKGMVLAMPSKHMQDTGVSLQAASGLTALFRDLSIASLVVGSLVNAYVGSVRAAARVLGLSTVRPPHGATKASASAGDDDDDEDEIFAMNDQDDGGVGAAQAKPRATEVVLELLTSREWVELGSQIIVLEGGRNDRSGLEGYVGNVVEIVD